MQYVSLDSVVAEAMGVVGDGNDEQALKLLARQWVWRAVLKLPITEDNIKVCEITPKNLIIKKPSDMRCSMEIALYDSSGGFLKHAFHGGKKRIFPDNRLFPAANGSDGTPTNCVPVDISEDEHGFYLGTNGENVAKAKVRYFAYPLDNEGMPLIREDDVLACVYFVRFQASLKKNDNRSAIAQNKDLSDQEFDITRAKRKSLSLSEDKKKTISATMNRMIPNFNRSTF
jgi:hypothetical protein